MVQKTGSFSFLLCQRFLFETSIAIKPAGTNHNSYPISQASNLDIYKITHISLLMFLYFFLPYLSLSCMRGRSDNYICNKTAPALQVYLIDFVYGIEGTVQRVGWSPLIDLY
jgi:hypothetical protein